MIKRHIPPFSIYTVLLSPIHVLLNRTAAKARASCLNTHVQNAFFHVTSPTLNAYTMADSDEKSKPTSEHQNQCSICSNGNSRANMSERLIA